MSLGRNIRVFRAAATIESLRRFLDHPVAYDVDEYLGKYRAGDERALIDIQARERSIAPAFFAAIITEVNKYYLPKIIRHHRSPGRHLFAIADAYALGDDGLIQWLRAAGFEVERLPAGDVANP